MAPPALMYHDVVHEPDVDGSGFAGAGPAVYKLDWGAFNDHLDALAGLGTAPVAHDGADSTNGWWLTFDDAGMCSLEVAEVLSRRGWIGHFFVPTALIGATGFASADDLAAIHRLGHVVGSHSHTHPAVISALTSDAIAHEWGESTRVLAEIVGAPVTVASVPGGYTSAEVERAAAAAGVRTLFTSQPTTKARQVNGSAVLGRYAIRRTTTAEQARALVEGSRWQRQQQAAAWAARSLPKRLLGDSYPKVRRAVLGRRS